jgi:hypothetical protein
MKENTLLTIIIAKNIWQIFVRIQSPKRALSLNAI